MLRISVPNGPNLLSPAMQYLAAVMSRIAMVTLRFNPPCVTRRCAARSYVTFNLDPAARFSDGRPVTTEDVIFSWQLLRDKGRPNHRFYYSKVAKVAAVGERAVRFDFTDANDRELPLILGLMPVLP